ncbi:hypothetical protein AQUCO_06900048v1 [Aquilegia coerulea]|uniref:GATA-type domain-containing protein n=1 Tax=Aquilegia coerulea TaxID=218851 RepID=A0A2G5CB66_AQUCA|nr:hypothetical protein AQUCO_06900048v1 [Aquilegia coerulea]
MGISNTVNIFEPLPIDFTLEDLQDLQDETTKPLSAVSDISLYDFSPLCIPNDSLDDIGWLLPVPSFTDYSSTTLKIDSKQPLSFVDFPTTPEQDIEFNAKKRSLPKDFHHQDEEHVSLKKKKKLRSKRSSCGRVWTTVNANVLLPIRRRCAHCGTEETPQWRMGPMGPKTLCNACGVRYKSGRLVPEYRPASSPTFNSQVHSNSHKKIVRMRMTRDM